jgi:hypothetical protein
MKPVYKFMSKILFKVACRAARRGWVKPTRVLSKMAARMQDKFLTGGRAWK